MRVLRRLAGACLLGAAYLPLHRLLSAERGGPAAAATRVASDAAWTLGVSGTLIVVTFAWLFARMLGSHAPGTNRGAVGRGAGVAERLMGILERPRAAPFAVTIGLTTLVATLGVGLLVHGGAPTSVDEMTQLLHARAVVAGRLTIPLPGDAASWVVQNGIVVADGWASIYPPLHTLLLAVGVGIGAPWLVGPVMTGVATGALAWTAERLVGRRTGRVGAVLLLASPFWLVLGATHLSHTTAAMGLSVLALAALRARDGSALWAIAAGAAAGVAVSARPWVGLAVGTAIVAALWAPLLVRNLGSGARWSARDGFSRVVLVLVGGTPFALVLFSWNARLFGSPTRLGYSAAFGSAHGLGWHVDPWGNRYGPVEALAYTGADLVQLGASLFSSPLPALAVIGAGLLLVGGHSSEPDSEARGGSHDALAGVARAADGSAWRGSAVFAAWAIAAVAANAAYWHHGIHFGPRMLVESAPAWVVLFAAAAVGAFASSSASIGARLARWVVGISIVGGLALTPSTLVGTAARRIVITPPTVEGHAIVFVHGSWASRIAARLAATGMRRDSIETALRRNDVCRVDRYARALRGSSGSERSELPALDFDPLPGSPPHLEGRALSPGNSVRVDPAAERDPACVREARSDALGVLELEPLAWMSPPLEGQAVVVARDLGPAGNLATLEATDRTPYLYLDRTEGGPIILDYATGMELLWGGAAAEAGRAEGR